MQISVQSFQKEFSAFFGILQSAEDNVLFHFGYKREIKTKSRNQMTISYIYGHMNCSLYAFFTYTSQLLIEKGRS